MRNTNKKVFALIVVIALVVLCVLIMGLILSSFYSSWEMNYKGEENSFQGAVDIVVSNFNDKSIDDFTRMSDAYDAAVIVGNVFDKVSGKNATTSLTGTQNNLNDSEDVVVNLSDGYLSLVTDSSRVEAAVNKTIQLAKDLKERGVEFIYYELPYKLDTQDPVYKTYNNVYPDYTAQCVEKIRKAFEAEGINVLRFEQRYPEVAKDRKIYFFKTDHHWLPETGLMATKLLAEELNANYGFDIDTHKFDLDSYDTSETATMFGALAKKVTAVFSTTEEMTILKPLYDSDITVKIPMTGYDKTGRIEEAFYDWNMVKKSNRNNPYTLYACGNRPSMFVHNNLVQNGKRVLVVKTSMANVVTPFLAGVVEDLDILDIRSFGKQVLKYVDENHPDVVVMIYGTREFLNAGSFNF